MSFGFGFGLPSWQTLSGGFSPASLFTGGEQGVWYEPSPTNGTLFQDSAGTTPVTAVEQFVGLMLDKSKGLVLGPELVTNTGGPFVNTTGWSVTANGSISVVSGALRVTNNAASVNRAFVSLTTVVGATYLFETNVVAFAGGLVGGRIAAGTSSASTVNGTTDIVGAGIQQLRFQATATTTFVQLVTYGSSSGGTVDFAYATLKLLPGNHATQTTSAKRPKLAARYNLLTYSEQFDNGVWQKLSNAAIDATGVLAPDGTLTADLLYPLTTGTARAVRQNVPLATGLYTSSVAAKAAGKNFLVFGDLNSNAMNKVWFDLSNGTVGTQAAGYTGSIQSLGNGWYRCTVSNPSITPSWFYFGLSDADNSTTVTANGTDGIYIWGADLRPASQATGLIGPTYQRVVDAATYDAVGFLPYLQFDGLSWSMSTGSIDFSAGDKMTVWAGVRKLSDASAGILAELSANWNNNAGTFIFLAPDATGANGNYMVASRGTAASDANQFARSAITLAPVTNVVTATHDIPGDLSAIRLNGAASGTNGTGDQGSGNFGNYPLFIGARNNASTFLNGWLTSLIVRGAQSTQSQIEATESWVNGKTGAF